MKTIVYEPATPPAEFAAWYHIADSALANAGKPFFLPDFAESFEACPVILVRIDKLGKSIGSRFAGRYFNFLAAGVHFRSPELRKRLLDAGLPPDMAVSYDRSMICSNWLPCQDFVSNKVKFKVNGSVLTELNVELNGISKALEDVSRYNTMKTGDIIIPGVPFSTPVSIGDRLSLAIGGNMLMEIAVK